MVAVQNHSVVDAVLFEEHYKKVLPEAMALPADEVQRVNLDAGAAITSALAIVSGLRRMRETIVSTLQGFNIERFDRIEEYTKAFSVANSRYGVATKPPDALAEDYAAGLKLRDLLHADAGNLVARGFINGAALKDYTGLVGYRNVGLELQALGLLLKDNWESIQGRCGTDAGELEQALKLAQRLQLGAGEREVNPSVVAEYADIRNRMFTLFITAYEDARRAIQYLRWHEGDASDVAPALHTNKSSGTAKKKEETGSVPAPAASGVQSAPAEGLTAPALGKTGTDHGDGPFAK